MISGKQTAFSLVEVVLALGIAVLGIVVIIGLLSTGMNVQYVSSGNTDAANTATRILAMRQAAPTDNLGDKNPLPSLDQTEQESPGEGYVKADGSVVPDASSAAFHIIYRVGKTNYTEPKTANVYLALAWPAAAGDKAPNRYEVFTTVSW